MRIAAGNVVNFPWQQALIEKLQRLAAPSNRFNVHGEAGTRDEGRGKQRKGTDDEPERVCPRPSSLVPRLSQIHQPIAVGASQGARYTTSRFRRSNDQGWY